jgi:hypothetical protein
MADVKISNLPASTTPLAGTEELPIVQSGTTKKTSVESVLTSAQPSGTANGVVFLNGSKIATSGTALVFNGTNFSTTGNVGVGGILSVPAGTAALPSIAPTADLNTGVFFPAADTIAFSEGGAEAMRITSAGNVGIGTTTPQAKLDVNGNARLGSFDINSSGAKTLWIAGSDFSFGTFYGNALLFLTSDIERMRITSAGNVGIGATPNASALLDVQSTTKGVRMPNMTTTQKNAIASPAAGLMVFDTTLSKLSVYSGAAWETITSV